MPYLLEFKGRVILAMSLLVFAKLANVAVPLVLKEIIDALDKSHAVLVVPVFLIVGYGVLRLFSTLFGELRDAVFAKVTQRAIRRVALQVFEHLHSLSLRFHLDRQTGGVSRDIERGTRGIGFLLNFTLFNILPTLLEIGAGGGDPVQQIQRVVRRDHLRHADHLHRCSRCSSPSGAWWCAAR